MERREREERWNEGNEGDDGTKGTRGTMERREREERWNEGNEGDDGTKGTRGTKGTGLARGQRVAERGRGRVGSCGKWGCMLQNRDFFMVECTILRTCFDFYT